MPNKINLEDMLKTLKFNGNAEMPMNFLEQLEQKDDYLYQQLKEDYNKYLKANRYMNNKFPLSYKQTETFYEWVQSVLPEYM